MLVRVVDDDTCTWIQTKTNQMRHNAADVQDPLDYNPFTLPLVSIQIQDLDNAVRHHAMERLVQCLQGETSRSKAENQISLCFHPLWLQHTENDYLLSNSSSSSLEEEPIEKRVLDLGMSGEMLKEKEIRLDG